MSSEGLVGQVIGICVVNHGGLWDQFWSFHGVNERQSIEQVSL